MLNSQDFAEKLEHILSYYQLTASSFADRIGVQRSSISHLLSGRNKPGLEFVIKIVDCFPEVDLYWFLMNVGTFPKSEKEKKKEFVQPNEAKITHPKEVVFEQKAIPTTIEQPNLNKVENDTIERIIILYKDGSFKNFKPQM